MSYPDCKHKDALEVGLQYQDFVMEVLQQYGIYLQFYTSRKSQFNKGETMQGCEIKLDNRLMETGRLSIEIAEKSKSSNLEFVKSGIYRDDNTWLYIQGNYDCFYIFLKKFLIQLHKTGKYQEGEIPTLRKYYLPIVDADKYGHKIITENHNGQR